MLAIMAATGLGSCVNSRYLELQIFGITSCCLPSFKVVQFQGRQHPSQKIRKRTKHQKNTIFPIHICIVWPAKHQKAFKKSPMQDFIRRTLTMLTMVGVAALIGSSSRVSAHCHKLANFLPFLQHILTILPAVETQREQGRGNRQRTWQRDWMRGAQQWLKCGADEP